MRKYQMIITVEVEHGVNSSNPTVSNVREYVAKTLGSNMGHQRDNGIPIKVKGLGIGNATRID